MSAVAVMNTDTTALLWLVVNSHYGNDSDKRWRTYLAYTTETHLYIVDVHLPIVTKLKRAFAFLLSKGICLIDFGVLRELSSHTLLLVCGQHRLAPTK